MIILKKYYFEFLFIKYLAGLKLKKMQNYYLYVYSKSSKQIAMNTRIKIKCPNLHRGYLKVTIF